MMEATVEATAAACFAGTANDGGGGCDAAVDIPLDLFRWMAGG